MAKSAFRLTTTSLARMANVSTAAIERRLKSKAPPTAVVSERFDRLAQVAVLAKEVFEGNTAASDWLPKPNDALGGNSPLALCETELGARQVRRLRHVI